MVLCNNIHARSLVPSISLLLLAMLGGAHAHTHLSSLIINGAALPQFDGLRPYPPTDKDYPLADVSMRPNGINENDMRCGLLPYANQPANRKISIEAGSTIGLQWWHTSPGDEVLAPSHEGPCMVYLARSETGEGNVWFKIWEKGYDASRGKWCTDDLIAARGVLNGITIPGDIAPGNYLLRAEIIALHDAYKPHGAQPYVHCAELSISGLGSATPAGVAIPGVYTDAALYFDLYKEYHSFTIPGPAVYVPGSPSTPRSTSTATTSTTGSSSTPEPATGTTTGAPARPRCTVSISQAAISSWTENNNRPATQYNVIMTNVGSSPLQLKFRLLDRPTQMWNLVANSDGTYGLPEWTNGSLQPGQAFTWGYIVAGRNPLAIDLVVPDCRPSV